MWIWFIYDEKKKPKEKKIPFTQFTSSKFNFPWHETHVEVKKTKICFAKNCFANYNRPRIKTKSIKNTQMHSEKL